MLERVCYVLVVVLGIVAAGLWRNEHAPEARASELDRLERLLERSHLALVLYTHPRCPYDAARAFRVVADARDDARPRADERIVWHTVTLDAAIAATYSITDCPSIVGYVNGEAYADTRYPHARTTRSFACFVDRFVLAYADTPDERTCDVAALLNTTMRAQ